MKKVIGCDFKNRKRVENDIQPEEDISATELIKNRKEDSLKQLKKCLEDFVEDMGGEMEYFGGFSTVDGDLVLWPIGHLFTTNYFVGSDCNLYVQNLLDQAGGDEQSVFQTRRLCIDDDSFDFPEPVICLITQAEYNYSFGYDLYFPIDNDSNKE